METRTARVTYYIAICVFLIFLAVLVLKMTFWPVCTGGSTCDGWTVAGLVAAILGVSTTFLGILGAIALAAWWTSLDKRVEDRVTQLFDTRIQAVQNIIDQLDKQVDELRGKINAIEDTVSRLEPRIDAAFEATSPGYVKRLQYQRMLNEIDAQLSQETGQ